MTTLAISADAANALRYSDSVVEGSFAYRVIQRETTDQLRWTSVEEVVFEVNNDGHYWTFTFEVPLTEKGEYEDFVVPVAVAEVFKKTKVVTYYE